MKHLLAILLTCFAFTVFAQETKVPTDTLSAKGKKREEKASKYKNTERFVNMVLYKGGTYPMYKTEKGKYFIVMKSDKKNSPWSRKYIKKEEIINGEDL